MLRCCRVSAPSGCIQSKTAPQSTRPYCSFTPEHPRTPLLPFARLFVPPSSRPTTATVAPNASADTATSPSGALPQVLSLPPVPRPRPRTAFCTTRLPTLSPHRRGGRRCRPQTRLPRPRGAPRLPPGRVPTAGVAGPGEGRMTLVCSRRGRLGEVGPVPVARSGVVERCRPTGRDRCRPGVLPSMSR